MLKSFMEIFKGYLKENDTSSQGNILNIYISIQEKSDIVKLELGTDESYKLSVQVGKNINVTIISSNYFGARHGLESLSQLIWYDSNLGGYQIFSDVVVEDKPSFTYRGVMVDTSRNFFPIFMLKKIVDGMAFSKLNVLHLHLTDAVSFPIVLKNIEWLANGAYNSESRYTTEDVEELIEYSMIRGVRVLLEVDAPSHVSAGWHTNSTYKNLVICDENDILSGHLNPDNELSLKILQDVYRNLLNLMKNDDIFHIGNDEVNLDCWKKTKAAESYLDMTLLWVNYTNTMIEKLKVANENKLPKNIIMWSSPLTNTYSGLNALNHKKSIIVQFWYGYPGTFLHQHFRVIFSTVGHWYLDCGFGPWKPSQSNGVCDPFTPWQKFYTYRPWDNFLTKNLTEGGEVCLWSEQVAEESLQTRIWPRAAAFAERIWSDPLEFKENVYLRLDNFREIMRYRGLDVSAIWPKWCSLNPGSCK
ncbi:hypothetical protein HHI36_012586 [Cryptolaemus montrouzieri]|uniref:beta-N-acetylhexosaminidase n=1 Tax=Cryptolaemus montrouzieri TaxID=559131 RepID=A0ABD2NFS3_9CUCU